MSVFQIEISDEFLEIPQGIGIAYDIKPNDFGQLNTRSGITTNDFNLPATVKNRRLLNTTGRIDAKLYLKNRVISIGYVQVVERLFRKKIIKVSFFGNNADWFSLISDESIRSLDFSSLNHSYNLDAVLEGITSESNYCYPVINYGRLTSRATNNIEINRQDLVPALFAETVLKKIFSDIGIKLNGNLFQEQTFKELILPWTATEESKPSESFTFGNYQGFFTPASSITTFEEMIFEEASNSGNPVYTLPNGRFSNVAAFGSITFNLDWSFTIAGLLSSTFVIRGLVVNRITGETGSVYNFVNTAVGGTFTGTESGIILAENEDLIFQYTNSGSATSVNIDNDYTCDNTPMVVGNTLPDITKKDFIRYIVNAFGLLITYNDRNKTLSLNLSNNLYSNISNAIQWNSKLDMTQERKTNYVEFIRNYAQSNIFQYESDEGSPNGRGVLSVVDESLPESEEFYTAPFSGTDIVSAFTGATPVSLPLIVCYEDDSDQLVDEEREPRILLSNLETGRTSLNITDGVTTTAVTEYNVPSFSEISYSELLSEYYRDISKIINNKQSFEVYLRLTSSDVDNFDQGQIVRIESEDFIGYFYVSMIEDFNAEDSSYKCTLLRL